VPAGLAPEELRRVRGLFLDGEWPGQTPALEQLAARDAMLESFTDHEAVVLWFEHDLYDQLQLTQILDRLRERVLRERASGLMRLSLICIDQYLGPLTGPELEALWPARHAVTPGELDLAAAAWQAFTSPDPMEIETLLRGDTSALPFLEGALRRQVSQHIQRLRDIKSYRGERHRLVGLEHARRDHRRDRVRGVVQAVQEVERQRQDDEENQRPEGDLGAAHAFSSEIASARFATSRQRSVIASSSS